ncbi:iron-sulfur cluster repair di-iron protein [Bacillus carboniphilus]|uniref:Iron-sulfur cluster repair di-iron protein n=1 Tax=Bacillus carboniphilus TaxID=86663 RepID=A0ABY9JXL7_9BACI|nr:iron-sulfur cluster repair di-iron protein [Bacillus carboniphilus]WLR42365.1 iron-sulfur cluster repair di-iron protein [Bacillus carboniphilus]
MSQTFSESTIVADIVKTFPKASDLLKSYRIDFCCGGNRPIIEAIQERGLDKNEVLEKLNASYENHLKQDDQSFDWNSAPSSEIIDLIIQKHHEYLREELPQLSPYITKVNRVHGPQQPHLTAMHDLFFELKAELLDHIVKEEKTDFPLLLQYEENPSDENRAKLMEVLDKLEEEHEHAGSILKQLREVTSDYTPPEGACGTYRLVYRRLEALEDDLFQHIHRENNILFNRVQKAINS